MFRRENLLLVTCLVAATAFCAPESKLANTTGFSFIVTSDTREFTAPRYSGSNYFEGVCEAIRKVGPGDFMLSPGDIDPPHAIRDTLDEYFGTNYQWIPVVGNHEAETPADMAWLRRWGSNDIPGLVQRGPPGCETTTYSFDRGPVHFVVINQYYDGRKDTGSNGDVVDQLYEWLKADLEQHQGKPVMVIGHEPILPVPDMTSGRMRHESDSLNMHPENTRRFQRLLEDHGVLAYFCAHTHNASVANLNGVWQIDSGHARGKGDKGAPSTFLKVHVGRGGHTATVDIYRQLEVGKPYKRIQSFRL